MMNYVSPTVEPVAAGDEVTPATLAFAVYLFVLAAVVWDVALAVNYAVAINVATEVNVTIG